MVKLNLQEEINLPANAINSQVKIEVLGYL